MATYLDLVDAFMESPSDDPVREAAQNDVFRYLSVHLDTIGHWPTRATPDLFAIAVQKHLQKDA